MTQASAAKTTTGQSHGTASGQGLTEEQARAIIAPWYSLFNVRGRGDVRTIAERFAESFRQFAARPAALAS